MFIKQSNTLRTRGRLLILLPTTIINNCILYRVSKKSKNLAVGRLWSRLNPGKYKEIRINFSKREKNNMNVIVVNGQPFELVKSAKILGMTITENLRCNDHVCNITGKASKRSYLPIILKQSGVDTQHKPYLQYNSPLQYKTSQYYSYFRLFPHLST